MMQLRRTARHPRWLVQIGRATLQLCKAESRAERDAARARLRAILSSARGLPMKVGRYLAYAPDDPLRSRCEIEPLPLERIVPDLEAQLGAPVERVFRRFEPGIAAASLGQVHEAQLRGGPHVAVKVRYPGIREALRWEMRLASLAPSVGADHAWGFDLHACKSALRDTMERELDYVDEARRQHSYAEQVRVSGLVVPHVYRELCRESVLVQSYEAGATLDEVRAWPHEDRLRLAHILLETLFTSTFRAGLVHGDPHPGNYRYRRDVEGRPEVVLYDYGCTVDVPERTRLSLLKRLLRGHQQGDKLDSLQAWLGEIARTDLGVPRAASPARLFLLLRALHGALLQIEALDVALPWRPLLEQTCGATLVAQASSAAPCARRG